MSNYLVWSKPDDYGHCRTELIDTTAKKAEQYYFNAKIEAGDEIVLKKYLGEIEYDEERKRTSEERFYGTA